MDLMTTIRRKFLSVPDVIEANKIPVGSESPKGIIYQIKSQVSDILSYVKPSYKGELNGFDINAIVRWSSMTQVIGKGDYLQVKLEHGYVYPTYYSIKGYQNSCFAKEWYLYGLNEENGEETLLSENKSAGSTFCGTAESCDSNNWATFSINPVQKVFKYFRMKCKTSSNNAYKVLMLGGFELYGVYSIDGRTSAKLKENIAKFTCCCIAKFTFYSLLRFTIYIS